MARKKLPEEHENHERWLVSYADFITLLFAFFVVMYAISSVNEGKYRVLSDTLESAFQQPPSSGTLLQNPNKPAQLVDDKGKPIPLPLQHKDNEEKREQTAKKVLEAMQPLIENKQVQVSQSPKGITVEINANNLFNSGDAVLQPKSADTLAAVAEILLTTDNAIQVEGHTDNIPINNPAYPSNWELSSSRAGSVVRLFTELGVSATRMVAIGYADNRPMDTNATPEGRLRNRRVNILILHQTEGNSATVALPSDALGPSPTTIAPPAAR